MIEKSHEHHRKIIMSSKIEMTDRANWELVNKLCMGCGLKMLDDKYESYVFRIANQNGRMENLQ